MLINLGMYENMIAEALHTGIVFYLSGLLSLLAGLAIVNCTIRGARTGASSSRSWLAYDDRRDHPHRHAAVAVAIGSTIYGGRASTIAVALIIGALGAFSASRLRAARVSCGKAMTFELRILAP